MDRIFKVFQSQTEAEKRSIVKQTVLDPDSTEYEAKVVLREHGVCGLHRRCEREDLKE